MGDDTRTPQEELDNIRALLIEYHMQKIQELEDGCKPVRLEADLNWELHLIGRYRVCWKKHQKEKNKYALA